MVPFLGVLQRASDQLSFLNSIQLYLYLAISIAFFLLLFKYSPRLRKLKRNAWLIVFHLILICSSLWSLNPQHSLITAIWLCCTSFFSYMIVTRYQLRDFIALIFYGLLLSVFVSIILVVIIPNKGIHVGELHTGAWKGIYFHKSGFAREAALSGVIGLFILRNPFRIIYFFLVFFIVYKAQSAASLVALATIFGFYLSTGVFSKIKQLKKNQIFIFVLLLIGGIGFLIQNLDVFVQQLGKSVTFDARLTIWAFSIINIQANPWLGYGYNSFWLEDSLSQVVEWDIPHAHNHFLDLLLDMGIIGLLVFLVILIRFFKSLFRNDSIPRHLYKLAFSSILLVLIISSSEEVIYSYFSTIWIYFVSMILFVENNNYVIKQG